MPAWSDSFPGSISCGIPAFRNISSRAPDGVGDDDARPAGGEQQRVQRAGRTAAYDQHGFAGQGANRIDTVDHAGEHFDPDRVIETEVIRECMAGALGRNAVLSQSTVAEDPERREVSAVIWPPCFALRTEPTAHIGRNRDSPALGAGS